MISTIAANTTRSTARAIAAERSLSRAAILASDMVCVRPAKFPANISVAPSSDTASGEAQDDAASDARKCQRQGDMPKALQDRGAINGGRLFNLRCDAGETQFRASDIE